MIMASSTDVTSVANQTVNMTNITKLSYSDYLMWSFQVHALLDGYNLVDYLMDPSKHLKASLSVKAKTSSSTMDCLVYSPFPFS